jgi:ribosomal protein S18 acetylase RimI-like enzyme
MAPGDKSALMAILASTSEFKPAEIVVAEEVIECFLNEGCTSGYRVWVAVEGTVNVIGYVCFGQTPLTEGTWDIYWIAVAGTWRGRSVGRALLQHAEAEIRDGDGRMILVETSSKPEYQQAMIFYGRMGYLPVSVITDFYAPGDSKITLQKLLVL